jgi:hypothetical protein
LNRVLVDRSERYANDNQSSIWTAGQLDDLDFRQRFSGTIGPVAGLETHERVVVVELRFQMMVVVLIIRGSEVLPDRSRRNQLKRQSFTRRSLRGEFKLDVRGADLLQAFADHAPGEFGLVTFAA